AKRALNSLNASVSWVKRACSAAYLASNALTARAPAETTSDNTATTPPSTCNQSGAESIASPSRSRRRVERLEPRQAQLSLDLRDRAGRQPFHRMHEMRDVVRRGAAAAAEDVDQPGLRPFRVMLLHRMGRFVVPTHRVRQPGVRVRTDGAFGDAR